MLVQKRNKVWKDNRLIYYSADADQNYWDDHWKTQINHDFYKRYEKGELDELAPLIKKYLNKNSHIIEAGCGSARFVVSLMSNGYQNVEGIDWGSETIETVKKVFPNLPVRR